MEDVNEVNATRAVEFTASEEAKIFGTMEAERAEERARRLRWGAIALFFLLAVVINVASLYNSYSDVINFFSKAGANCTQGNASISGWKVALTIQYPILQYAFRNKAEAFLYYRLIKTKTGGGFGPNDEMKVEHICGKTLPKNVDDAEKYVEKARSSSSLWASTPFGNPANVIIPFSCDMVNKAQPPYAELVKLFTEGIASVVADKSNMDEDDLWDYMFTPRDRAEKDAQKFKGLCERGVFAANVATSGVNMALAGAMLPGAGPVGFVVGGLLGAGLSAAQNAAQLKGCGKTSTN